MAERHLVDVGAIAAANHRRHRDAPRPEMAEHHRVTPPDAVIGQVQKAKPVALMDIHAGVVNHQIGVMFFRSR